MCAPKSRNALASVALSRPIWPKTLKPTTICACFRSRLRARVGSLASAFRQRRPGKRARSADSGASRQCPRRHAAAAGRRPPRRSRRRQRPGRPRPGKPLPFVLSSFRSFFFLSLVLSSFRSFFLPFARRFFLSLVVSSFRFFLPFASFLAPDHHRPI